jgi:23S rRNA (uracil1939-C5)-methyltransferase
VGGVSFLISPTSFFQTNVEAARLLVELVLQEVPRGAAVLDLYAGAGLFALPLVRHGHAVIAVESSRGAVADAEASLRLNRLPEDRCRFIPRPVEAALRTLRGADVVVLDPPREGCSPGVTQDVFGRLQPNVAVYVSCNPDTLARDLASAAALGYQVRSIQPVDMFPHTPHIETVVVLVSESRRAAARPPLRPRPAR